MGHSEEIERILEELEQNDGETIPISESFLFIPNSSIIGISKSKVDFNLHIGKECKILGNYDIKGNIYIDDKSNIYGSLNSTGDIYCGKEVKIHGNVVTKGDVNLSEDTHVVGKVSGNKIFLSKTSTIQGTILARNGTKFIDKSKDKATEKVKRFESNADVIDEVKEMLE